MDKSYKVVRTIHYAMFFAALLYVVVAEKLVKPAESRVDPVLLIAISAIALLVGVTGLIVRNTLVLPTAASLATDPSNLTLLNRWRAGCIVSFAMGEAVVLFGLVLRFVGAQIKQAALLYFVGLLVLLIATPKKPVVEVPGLPPQP